MQIEEDEVSLKRTWTHDNKDEYKLNTKVLIKNEINNIMESCGLSRSNPYNIVHQGLYFSIIHINYLTKEKSIR